MANLYPTHARDLIIAAHHSALCRRFEDHFLSAAASPFATMCDVRRFRLAVTEHRIVNQLHWTHLPLNIFEKTKRPLESLYRSQKPFVLVSCEIRLLDLLHLVGSCGVLIHMEAVNQ